MRYSNFFKYLTLLLLFVIILAVSFLYMILENSPCVPTSKKADIENAVRVRNLIKRSFTGMLSRADTVFISASEDELNGLIVFISRGVKHLSGRVSLTPKGIDTDLSFKIPENPIGNYVNISFGIGPSSQGLVITHASLGRIAVPGRVVLYISRVMLNLALDDNNGSKALNSVQAVTIHDNLVTVRFRPVPDLKSKLAKTRKKLEFVRDEMALLGNPADVRIYYAKLIEIDKTIPDKVPVSLVQYINPLFKLARERGGNKANENQAAVLALAMFLGSNRIESLIGPVRTEEMMKYQHNDKEVVLAGRTDERLHFLISAGLKIVSDRGISNIIGEFKELIDAGKGGTGFSFVDLAADRAGVCFAETATDEAEGALWIQSVFSGELHEEMFFPDINELPEGLTQAEFEQFYGNIGSDKYLYLVHSIDQCIGRLRAYQGNIPEQNKPDKSKCKISDIVPERLKQILVARKKLTHSDIPESESQLKAKAFEKILPGKNIKP